MKPIAIGIPSWSNRVFRARKTYCCDNCGGTIPRGTKYRRHVVRLGLRKFRDPLKNIHMHLDCEAPWYQPDNLTHRLRNLGRLQPSIESPVDIIAEPFRFPQVSIHTEALGMLVWEPPADLAATLGTGQTGEAALAEAELVLGIVLSAIASSAGNKRQAMRVNNLITQLVSTLA